MNITKHQQSESSIIETALRGVKVCDADNVQISGVVSAALDSAFLYVGLNTSVEDRNATKLMVINDCRKHFSLLAVPEIAIAIDNGVHGKYGEFVGISAAIVYKWLTEYSLSQIRKIKMLEINKPEPFEMSNDDKEKMYWNNLVNAWEHYKEHGYYNDMGNAIYRTLEINKKINFTSEQKEIFKSDAKHKLIKEFNPLKHIGNFVKINECKLIIEGLNNGSENSRIISEAKNIALNQFFKELLEMDMNIIDLFNE